MRPFIQVSCAEVLDKITILEIKRDRLESENARSNVSRELQQLSEIANGFSAIVSPLKDELRKLNERLWDLQNAILGYEQHGEFGKPFVQCALDTFHSNEERARIKRRINEVLESELVEEKQYG